MVIGPLLVVAAAVACSPTSAAPIFFDICDDCSEEVDVFTGLWCDLICETVEECDETTMVSTGSTTVSTGGTTSAGSTTTGASTSASSGATEASSGASEASTAASTSAGTTAK